jgi:hypothetical protein
MEQIDLTNEIDRYLKYVFTLASDINDDIFSNTDRAANIEKFTWEYPRLRDFHAIMLEYIILAKQCLDDLGSADKE